MYKCAFARVESTKRRRKFIDDRSGNVTIIFGFSVLVLSGAVGGAIDYARWFQTRNKVQAAMDSASLAGGRAMQLATTNAATVAINTASQYFERMRPNNLGGATPSFVTADNDSVVRGSIDFSVPSPFLSLLGFSSIPGRVTSETVIAAGGNAGTNLEVSLMLDTTGSMSGQKIDDLKAAAKDLVDIVIWDDQSQFTSKIALAPFSQYVNVGSYLASVSDVPQQRSISGGSGHEYGITCVTERTGTDAFTDERPNGSGDRTVRARSGDVGNAARDNDNNYSSTGQCRTSGWSPVEIPEIMPLSSNKLALKDRIDDLPAAGSTAGWLGTAWAWYLLSPKWTGIWTGSNLPAPYSDITIITPRGVPKLKKVAVLMTDGIYNTMAGQNYGDASSEATTISNNSVTLCNNMKAAGITVYTVGFHLGGNELAVNTLKSCASREASDPVDSPSYFFNATSGDELRHAFRQIALQLSTLRITK